MKIILKKNNKLLQFFFVFYWILLWSSISSAPHHIYLFNDGYVQMINAVRIFLPLLTSFLVIVYFSYVFLSEKLKFKKIELFFFLFFISQIIGLYFNKEKSFDINTTYLVILAIGTIFLFAICNQKRINNINKYFINISILMMTIILIFTFYEKLDQLNNLDLYKIFSDHDKNLLGMGNQRISGISRMLAIINLFFILHFFRLKNVYFKNFILFFLILFSTILFFMQSRGTLVCYFISMSIIIFFLIKNENSFKLKYFFILLFLPFFLYFSINHLFSYSNHSINNNTKIHNRILTTNTSGRYEIWYYTIKNYKYEKFFGYGPNGDRFFLKNFDKKNIYGNNTSNIWLYSLVSGGTISVFLLFLIFFQIKKIFQYQNKKIYENSIYHNFSIACLIFFLIRSLFENSFGLFSTDFLIMYLSLSYIINSSRKTHN